MQHYWGAKAIAARLSIKDHRKTLPRWVRQYGLPAYLRAHPSHPHIRQLYSNEALILAWELSRAADYRQHLINGKDVAEPKRILHGGAAQIERRMNEIAQDLATTDYHASETPTAQAS